MHDFLLIICAKKTVRSIEEKIEKYQIKKLLLHIFIFLHEIREMKARQVPAECFKKEIINGPFTPQFSFKITSRLS